MGRRDSNFIDPEFGRGLVRVQVDHRADKTNDQVIIQRDDKAMARVGEKFLRGGLYNGIIEDILGDLVEDMEIGWGEKFDFDHRLVIGPFYDNTLRYFGTSMSRTAATVSSS